MPNRIQRRRTAGWRMPAGAVYVGRPGMFGNPFLPGDWLSLGYSGDLTTARQTCVDVFRLWLNGHPEWQFGNGIQAREKILGNLHTLRGHDLACWCAPTMPCHADVLLTLANQPEPARV